MKEFKPIYVLASLLSAFAFMALVSLVFPKDGIQVSETFTIRFPQLSSFFDKEEKTDISDILALNDTTLIIDTSDIKFVSRDSLLNDTTPNQTHGEIKDPSLKLVTPLQYNNDDKSCMNNFFYALSNEINASKFCIMAIHKSRVTESLISYE